MANNDYKKLYPMDHFGRRFYCQRAKRNLARSEKHQARAAEREFYKREIRKLLEVVESRHEDLKNQYGHYDSFVQGYSDCMAEIESFIEKEGLEND